MILANTLLNWIVGGDADENRVPRLEWLNAPESWGVFLMLAVVAGLLFFVSWLYTREIKTCPTKIKWVLTVIRASVLMFLVILFLQPAITFVEQRIRKPNVVLLRDSSQSMDRSDEYRNPDVLKNIVSATGLSEDEVTSRNVTRGDLLSQVFQRDDQKLLNDLRQRAAIRVVDFAEATNKITTLPPLFDEDTGADTNTEQDDVVQDDVVQDDVEGNNSDGDVTPVVNKSQEVAIVDVGQLPSLVANGRATDIWQALKQSLEVSQLAAIILCSDGQHTTLDDPIEIAKKAKELGVPIYVIGIGDPDRPKNIAVSDVYALAKARPQEPFEIDTLVTGQDVAGETVTIDLLEHTVDSQSGKPGAGRPVKSQQVTFTEENEVIRHRFTHRVATPGKYVYSVSVPSLVGETTTNDNEKLSSVLEVTNEKVKVLLIAGSATWEYQMVHRLLQRDQGIILSCWLQTLDPERPQEGNESISVLPGTYEQLAKYNVVMMFDPNPDEFSSEWLEALNKFVDQNAGGLLYKAGPKYTSLFLALNRSDPIKNLLPVEFGNAEDSTVAQLIQSTNTRSSPLKLVLPNLDHQVMSFYPERRDNLTQWQNFPGVFWSYPARNAKPTTRVLLEHSDITLASDGDSPRPLLVAGRYGAGNTLFMGFDGTWRWRRLGHHAEFFDKFWIQTARFLVNTRSVQGLRRGTIDTDKPEYELGDTIGLSARLFDPRYEPLTLDQVSGTLKLVDSQSSIPVIFKKLAGQDGDYQLNRTAAQVGQYELTLDLPGARDENAVEPVTFRVNAPSVETKAFWLNETLLREIANASGGRYYQLDSVDELPHDLAAEEELVEWRSRPEPLWDINPWTRFIFFSFPVLLLAVEWALRKGFKLL